MKLKYVFFLTTLISIKPIHASDQYNHALEIYTKVAATLRAEFGGYSLSHSLIADKKGLHHEILPKSFYINELFMPVHRAVRAEDREFTAEDIFKYCIPYFSEHDAQNLVDQAFIIQESQKRKIFTFLTTGAFDPALDHEMLKNNPDIASFERSWCSVCVKEGALTLQETYSIKYSDSYPVRTDCLGKQSRIIAGSKHIDEIVQRYQPQSTIIEMKLQSDHDDDEWILVSDEVCM